MKVLEEVGTLILSTFDQQLFLQSARNVQETLLYKCEFADVVAVLACSRQGTNMAV